MKNPILKDKNNKIIKEGDKVKFFMGTGPADPFGHWESGIIKFINGIFMIIDEDSEWTAHGKILEIIDDNEIKSLQNYINNHKNLIIIDDIMTPKKEAYFKEVYLSDIFKSPIGNIFKVNSINIVENEVELILLENNEGKYYEKFVGSHAFFKLSDVCKWEKLQNWKPKTKRESKDEYFLKIAKLVSTRSTCPRRSVGCVITNKYSHIKATGYNGVPRNFPHCTDKPCGGESQESSKGLSSCMATHAEQNALLQCDNVMDIETIYITTSPCITCAKLIANTSCKEVIYSEEYTDTSGIDMLKKLNIKVTYKQI